MGNPALTRAGAFGKVVAEARQKSLALVEEVAAVGSALDAHAWDPAVLRNPVEIIDDMSDTLCTVVDLSESVRQVCVFSGVGGRELKTLV